MGTRQRRKILPCLALVTAACTTDDGSLGGSSEASGATSSDDGGTSGHAPTSDAPEPTSDDGDASSEATPESSSGELPTGDCYQPTSHPWADALCGASALPCRILVEEVLDPAPAVEEFEHFRFSRAAITHDGACAPVVSYGATTSPDDVAAVLAHRVGPGEWERVTRPDVHRASIAWDPALAAVRLIDVTDPGGASHTSYDGTAFVVQPAPPGQGGDAHSLGNGSWHAVARDGAEQDLLHVLGFSAGAWTDTPIGTTQIYDATLALSDTDESHLMFRARNGEVWSAYHAAPPYDAPELMFDAGPAEGVIGPMHLAMVGSTPHAISVRLNPESGWGEIVYVTRDGSDAWSVRVLASAAPNADTACPTATPDAATCEYAFVAHVPQHVLASHGGDVRLLWSERLVNGTAEVSCDEPDAPCAWTPTAEETMHTLWISTPTADGFDSAVLLDRDFTIEDADIDGTGQIHVVGSTREEAGSRIEYLLLAP